MKTYICSCLTLLAFFLAPSAAEPSAKRIAPVLHPFVDSHSLAGAVTLVANKDKVLSQPC